jgi:hypothetical protein
MPRLAASIWRGANGLQWPPPGSTPDPIYPDPKDPKRVLEAHRVDSNNLAAFWTRLVDITFGDDHPTEPGEKIPNTGAKNYAVLRPTLAKGGVPSSQAGFTTLQRSTHQVLDYFDPVKTDPKRMTLRIIRVSGYDFILHQGGLDIFVPENPFKDKHGKQKDGRAEILRYYRFRETGAPPIGLPGRPADLAKVKNLTEPTGTSQAQDDWVRGMASQSSWWITGAIFRAIMTEYPRIIASLWYEEAVWDPKSTNPNYENSYAAKFNAQDGLKTLIEERLEVELPDALKITSSEAASHTDVEISESGMVFPHPKGAPQRDELILEIESGRAGNPVFTDTGCL